MRISQARLTAGLDRYARIDLDTHQQIFGAIQRMNARQLVEMVERVDIRGRGGAAFPFARKIRAVMDSATARRRKTVILVNGTEGEPGSAKDKMLLLRSPYLVLGGALLACRALGGKEIVVGVAGTGPDGLVARSVAEAAMAEPELKALVRVVEVPDRFVSGEGGALVNAETFAQLSVLAMLGPDGYASVGTADEPGTVLLTVGGAVTRSAVVEVPSGFRWAWCSTSAARRWAMGS